jgi:hypothetical protein
VRDSRNSYSPDRIASLAARCLTGHGPAAVEEIRRDGVWDYVATHACRVGIGAMMLDNLRRRGVDLPKAAAIQLDAYREHVTAAQDYVQARMELLFAHLQAHCVPFLLLKGAALNAVLYDQPGLRPMLDVDVLIHTADARRADEVLRGFGCRPGPDLVREDFYPRYYYEREYFLPCNPAVKIDLHVRPFRPLRYARTVPDDALWDQPLQVGYGATSVAIPNHENMLIHLAVHAACHGAAGLKWLQDLRLWLDRFAEGIDVEALADKCGRWKLTWPVIRALEQVGRVFGERSAALARLMESLGQHRVGLLDRLAVTQAPDDADHPVAGVVINLLCAPGLRFRLGYLRAVLLPGQSHLAQLYSRRHPGWPIVAHVVRIWRGVTRRFTRSASKPV